MTRVTETDDARLRLLCSALGRMLRGGADALRAQGLAEPNALQLKA